MLHVTGHPPLPVHVMRASEGVADLTPLGRRPQLPPDGSQAVLEAQGGRRVEGDVVHMEGGALRFVRALPRRRVAVRAPITLPALLVPERLDGLWRSRTLDLSAGGALVADAESVPLGAKVTLVLDVEEDPADVEVNGQVVRAAGRSLRAIRFEAVRPGDRLRIARLVALEHLRRLS